MQKAQGKIVDGEPRGLNQPPPWVAGALTYIHACWREDFTVADLAQAVQVSPFHLIRIFRQHVGVPPSAYRRTLRIRAAQKLLRAGWSPGDVAAECGFYDQSHLNRTLKTFTGLTAGEYARRHTEPSRASGEPSPGCPGAGC